MEPCNQIWSLFFSQKDDVCHKKVNVDIHSKLKQWTILSAKDIYNGFKNIFISTASWHTSWALKKSRYIKLLYSINNIKLNDEHGWHSYEFVC